MPITTQKRVFLLANETATHPIAQFRHLGVLLDSCLSLPAAFNPSQNVAQVWNYIPNHPLLSIVNALVLC